MGLGSVSWLAGRPTRCAFPGAAHTFGTPVARLQLLSPLTVAGPRRLYTGLPLIRWTRFDSHNRKVN